MGLMFQRIDQVDKKSGEAYRMLHERLDKIEKDLNEEDQQYGHTIWDILGQMQNPPEPVLVPSYLGDTPQIKTARIFILFNPKTGDTKVQVSGESTMSEEELLKLLTEWITKRRYGSI